MAKVMIEVEMLDVSKTHLDKIGFNWANGLWARGAGGARNTTFPFARGLYTDTFNIRDIDNNNSDPNAQNSAIGLESPVLGILDLTNLSVIMQFLTQDTSTKFIARPKILTLSDETAEVNLTVHEAIGVETVTTEGSVNENIEREETGTKLRVTPHVNPYSQEVTLFVEMFNRESTDSGIVTQRLTAGQIKNVEERGTKNTIRLKNGETLYIGGLIRREEKETVTKIPLLGDIPILGKLFSYREQPGEDNQDRELLVFITPRIVDDKPAYSAQTGIFLREQQDASKRESVKIALDSFTR
jgi:type II secretory pathway component GspD/PulD (secretin)